MTDSIAIAIIAAAPPTLVALLAWIASKKNGKAILDVHLSMNSRLDQLLESTKKTSHAEGMEAQRKLDSPKS
jgi:hypothetical protein